MDQERTDASDLRRPNRAQDRIAQKTRAEAMAWKGSIDRQPAERHNGYRVRHVASYASGRFDVSYRARGQSVVAGNFGAGAHDVRTRRSTQLVLAGAPTQPLIQERLTGIEFG